MKKAKSFLVVILLFMFNFVMSQDIIKVKDKKYARGVIYTGDTKNGVPDGYGEATFFHSGEIYKGNWKKGMKEGQGNIISFFENNYIGEWKSSKKNGYGEEVFSVTKSIYKGGFKNDTFHGEGEIVFKNGTVIQGEFVNGLKEGKFKITYENGSSNDVNYKANKITGNENIHNTANFVIEKKYKDGLYTGDWKNEKPHGQGQIVEKYNYYKGAWVNGIKQGKGYAVISGTNYKGMFKNNLLNGKAISKRFTSQVTYIGNYKGGKKHGDFIYVWGDETKNVSYDMDEKILTQKEKNDILILEERKKKRKKEKEERRKESAKNKRKYEEEKIASAKKQKIKDQERVLAKVEREKATEERQRRREERKIIKEETVLQKEKRKEEEQINKKKQEKNNLLKELKTEILSKNNEYSKSAKNWQTIYHKIIKNRDDKDVINLFLSLINHPHPPKITAQQNFKYTKNGFTLEWQFGLLYGIEITKSSVSRKYSAHTYMKKYSYQDYLNSGVKKTHTNATLDVYLEGVESYFNFKKSDKLNKKPKYLIVYKGVSSEKEEEIWAVEMQGRKIDEDLFKMIFKPKTDRVVINYWKKRFNKVSGITFNPEGKSVSFNKEYKGKIMESQLDYNDFVSIIESENITEFNKYYNEVTNRKYCVGYSENERCFKDVTMSLKNGKGALWIYAPPDEINKSYSITYIDKSVLEADERHYEKKSTNEEEAQSINEKISEARYEKLIKVQIDRVLSGEKNVGLSWGEGQFVELSKMSRVFGYASGRGALVKNGLIFRGYFVKGTMHRDFTITDTKSDNYTSGMMNRSRPTGEWVTKQDGEIITYYYNNEGIMYDARINNKSLLVAGVADRNVIYKLEYKAIQRTDNGKLVSTYSKGYSNKMAQLNLSGSTLLSSDTKIGNTLNYNQLSSTVYMKVEGTCDCNSYYSWGGWDLMSCEKVSSIPGGSTIEYDTCEGMYLPEKYTPFWLK